jgi:BCD family chlorophyll transporter-like MFS transporter
VNTLARPSLQQLALKGWRRVGTRFLPFADAASADLPLSRLLRLSLFQVSVGMALVLLNGTLNRVMIVELGVSASLVALMVALPIVFAPLRAFVGFRSDHHRSALGWRRVPYLWFGSMALFGGLAILPFALLVLTGEGHGPAWIGQLGAALAFLLVGAGLHTVQTAGLALATDLAPAETRPRVVALLYVTLLLGMVLSAGLFSLLLTPFSHLKLVQVIQGAALVAVVFNAVALWKQEARDPKAAARRAEQPQLPFRAAWRQFIARRHARRLLVAVGLGSAAFSMQDILLEPYGGQILRLGVGATTVLTALMAGGSLLAFALAARALQRGADAMRLAASGVLVGVLAFAMVIFAEPLQSAWLLRAGAVLIGFGGGLFSVATLTVAMGLDTGVDGSDGEAANGLALGAWGAVQATAAGAAIACGGALRDGVSTLAVRGALGPALESPAVGYSFVYHLEIALLFATLVALGPLVRTTVLSNNPHAGRFGLAEFPG